MICQNLTFAKFQLGSCLYICLYQPIQQNCIIQAEAFNSFLILDFQYNNFIIGMQLMKSKVHSNKSFYHQAKNNSFFLQQSKTRSLKKNLNFSISQLLSATSTQMPIKNQQLQNPSIINISPIFQKPNFNQKFMMLRRRKHFLGQKSANQIQKSKRQQQIKQKIKERIKFQFSQINSSTLLKTTNKQQTKNSAIRISSSKILHNNPRNKKTHIKQQDQSKVQIRGQNLPFRINQPSLYKGRTQSSAFIKKMASFSNVKCKTASKTDYIRKLQNTTILSFQKSVQVKRCIKSSLGGRNESKIHNKIESDSFAQIQPWDAIERLPSIEF